MSWRTILVLVLIVAGLVFYATRTARHEETRLADRDVALFPGVDAGLVVAIRLENVRRDLHMRFERTETGEWRLTDPVAERAESGRLEFMLQAAARARGPLVDPAEARDLSRLGLDPPRFVLDLETRSGDTSPGSPVRRQRAEFGAVELDGARMFARLDGRVLLISRELEPILDLELHELRASNVSDLDALMVMEVQRTGSAPGADGAPAVDVSFEAVQEGRTWRATSPVVGRLDPIAMGLYVRSMVNYRYESIFDEGARTLSALGLDPPELRIRFGTVGTDDVELVLGRTGTTRAGGWLGTRLGSSIVWGISSEDAEFFAIPLEDLLDHRLIQARRGAVQRVEIDSKLGRVRLERGPKNWTCSSASVGSDVFGPAEPAETRVVEDLLGEFERYELTGYLRDRAFELGPAPLHWRILADGEESAGTFGGPYTDSTGAQDVLFQRAGDTAVAHGNPRIVDALTRESEHYLSLSVLATNEVDLTAVRVSSGDSERRFVRNAKGLWTVPGGEVEARDLYAVLEGLLFVRATERIPESVRAPLERSIEVELVRSNAPPASFTVGLAPHAGSLRAEVELDGQRAALQDVRLHEKLSLLLASAPEPAPR